MKYNDYYRGRVSGMETALEIVQQGGIEKLEDEVRKRRITGIDPERDFDRIQDGRIDSIMKFCMCRIYVISVAVLHDTFGFGPGRMERFTQKFNEATELMARGKQNGALFSDIKSEVEQVYGWTIKGTLEGVLVQKKGNPDKRKMNDGREKIRKA